MAFYMMHRIDVTGEFTTMSVEQWTDNSERFNIKFLVDINTLDNQKELKSNTYGKHVKSIVQCLRLPTNKILHLGRNVGTKMLDFDEVHEGEIHRMGQWNQSVYDESYSSKLPRQAIHSLTGYDNAMYFDTRTTVMPTIKLLQMTATGNWSFAMADELAEVN
jgi:hypothetical protein